MNKKLIGTAIIAASTTAFTSGCGILETIESVELPAFRLDSNSYVVQPGDTLDSVASRYKIDPDSLLNVNSLQLAELIPGQRLVLLRDEEVASMAAFANRKKNLDSSSRVAIGGGQASGVGQSVVLPNATQTVAARSSSTDSPVIRTDVIASASQNSEQIIGIVKSTETDALLDDQPVFIPEKEFTSNNSAQVERPQGVETIVQTVEPTESVAMVASAKVPTAATIEISDADAQVVNRRITVNQRDKGWNWPVLGTITRDFDLREINRQGLDIDPGKNAAVQAAADGEVVYSGRDLASYGNLVILRHDNNFLSAYSKVSEIFVEENQKVNAGDLIASVGEDESGSNEIHFEIRRNGEPVNPIDYLPAL